MVRQVPDVKPKAGEVKLRVTACGICGSDVHGYLGKTGRRTPPMIMGHEFAGVVEGIGEGTEGLPLGTRVAVYPVAFCGACEMCRRGKVHLCLHKRAFGVLDVDGAFAESICVPAACCFPLSENISDELGSLMEPLAVAYRGVEHAGELAGKTVLVVGAGTIGLLALACIKRKNPAIVIVSDRSKERLAVARQMGADETVCADREDCSARVLALTKERGADVAVEAVGIAETVRQALRSLAIGGHAVWIGNSQPVIEVNMQQVVTRELSIQGSFLYGYDEFQQVVSLVNEGAFNLSPLVSRTITLEEAPAYFHKLANDPEDLIKVVVANP